MNKKQTQEDMYFDALLESLLDKKVQNLITFEIKNYPLITERIVLCTANNTIHLNALAESLKDTYKELKTQKKALGLMDTSGEKASGWLIVETDVCMIHLLTEEMRSYYELDELFTNYATVVHHETDY